MKQMASRYPKILLGFLALLSLLLLLAGVTLFFTGQVGAKLTHDPEEAVPEHLVLAPDHSGIRAAMAVQERHTLHLLRLPEVVGTATGVSAEGLPAVLVFTRQKPAPGRIPEFLDSHPVVVQVTGEFRAMPAKPQAAVPAKFKTLAIDPRTWFPRPVPIGVSTGNANECSAGTIGARVKKEGKVYALSNNHVYARENEAATGEEVLQPGRYDTQCNYTESNVIGTLADFVEIDFSTSATNVVDAAIADSDTSHLGNATPLNGYGTPKSATAPASIGQKVQKYGRTTALTKGTVRGINAIVNVGYDAGTARFVQQILVYSSKTFIRAGDSGSLLVTDPGKNPVGLLFAGTSNGKWAIANPIGPVLDAFGVAIDGE